jgi:hypothetical protein
MNKAGNNPEGVFTLAGLRVTELDLQPLSKTLGQQ